MSEDNNRKSYLKVPNALSVESEAHRKWMQIVKQANLLVEEDVELQEKAAKSLRLKERRLPTEVLGRNYAAYCDLLNRIYDAYLNCKHLQRAQYMLEIVRGLFKRIFELRNEIVHYIVNDYIYVDAALTQIKLTPFDIEILVPYHIPLEIRPDSMENMLQKMWKDAVKRKNAPPPKFPKQSQHSSAQQAKSIMDNFASESTEFPEISEESVEEEDERATIVESVHTIIPEEYIQAVLIQRTVRFKSFYVIDYRQKSDRRKTYFAAKVEEPPLELKNSAAALIQSVYREFIRIKRKRYNDTKTDILLGITPDPFRDSERFHFDVENNKVYEHRYKLKQKLKETYMKDLERENARLILCRKDNQIEDITDHIRAWFMEWYYGYGFFPEYPYPVEGGTILVIRGDYPSVDEKKEADEKYLASIKGKTKEMLKQEKENAKFEAEIKAELAKETAKKEAENLFKMRCIPDNDPGYKVQTSNCKEDLVDIFRNYFASWSLYDNIPPEKVPQTLYGYLKPLLTEELMCQMHKECRVFVDEFMRLDLKLLIKAQQAMYKRVDWKWPKKIGKTRKKPKAQLIPKVLNIDEKVMKNLEEIFDLSIITKPTNKIKDIRGDLNFAAYDLNIQDPDVRYPPPGYGDIRHRLTLSCAFGAGIEQGAKKLKSVMLVGPERNGKSFLVDCVAGEINAVKIDISPEVFSAVASKPSKKITQAFLAARVFQPAIIFCKNIERVFIKKMTPELKLLKSNAIKASLTKLVKAISPDDKVIFIATCTFPKLSKMRPMCNIFSEILLVPRTDYGTLSLYLSEELRKIRSVPRDFNVKSLAQLLQGYGFGMIMELFHNVMTPERIVRLNVTPLSPSEFLEPLIENAIEPVTLLEYTKEYTDFVLNFSPLRAEREEYNVINANRAYVYEKMRQKKEKAEAAAKANK